MPTLRPPGHDPDTPPDRGFEEAYWEQVWSRVRLPVFRDPRSFHELHHLFRTHLPPPPCDLLEVGCAPGSWLAYFAKHFGCRVAGVEYARHAHAKTLENLGLLGVEGQVALADFFEFSGGPYDVVFSYGFVEHFKDPAPAFDRLIGLCKPGGIVVTAIPSLSGLNWWLSRTFRPHVAAGHFPMTKAQLGAHHESRGLSTLCLRRYGGLQVVSPWSKTRFEGRWPRTARGLGLPFQAWSRAVSLLTRALKWYPEGGPVYSGTLYIGRKRGDCP